MFIFSLLCVIRIFYILLFNARTIGRRGVLQSTAYRVLCDIRVWTVRLCRRRLGSVPVVPQNDTTTIECATLGRVCFAAGNQSSSVKRALPVQQRNRFYHTLAPPHKIDGHRIRFRLYYRDGILICSLAYNRAEFYLNLISYAFGECLMKLLCMWNVLCLKFSYDLFMPLSLLQCSAVIDVGFVQCQAQQSRAVVVCFGSCSLLARVFKPYSAVMNCINKDAKEMRDGQYVRKSQPRSK